MFCVDEPHSSDGLSSFPTELLEQVLSEAWLSSMTPIERKTFVDYVSRTSKTWAETLARVVTTDLYTSLLPPDRNRHSLEMEYPLYWRTEPEYPPFQLSRSYTLQLPLPRSKASTGQRYISDPQKLWKRAISALLWTFRGMSYAPNLARLSVEYFYPTSDNKHEYIAFHLPIIRLEVEYTFYETTSWILDELGLNGSDKQTYCKAMLHEVPDIYQISASDNEPFSFGDILRTCPHLEITEPYDLRVKILSSSNTVSKQAALVHGSLSFITKFMRIPQDELDNDSHPPTHVIQGRALALVLNDKQNDKKALLDLAQGQRFLELFIYSY